MAERKTTPTHAPKTGELVAVTYFENPNAIRTVAPGKVVGGEPEALEVEIERRGRQTLRLSGVEPHEEGRVARGPSWAPLPVKAAKA